MGTVERKYCTKLNTTVPVVFKHNPMNDISCTMKRDDKLMVSALQTVNILYCQQVTVNVFIDSKNSENPLYF